MQGAVGPCPGHRPQVPQASVEFWWMCVRRNEVCNNSKIIDSMGFFAGISSETGVFVANGEFGRIATGLFLSTVVSHQHSGGRRRGVRCRYLTYASKDRNPATIRDIGRSSMMTFEFARSRQVSATCPTSMQRAPAPLPYPGRTSLRRTTWDQRTEFQARPDECGCGLRHCRAGESCFKIDLDRSNR